MNVAKRIFMMGDCYGFDPLLFLLIELTYITPILLMALLNGTFNFSPWKQWFTISVIA